MGSSSPTARWLALVSAGAAAGLALGSVFCFLGAPFCDLAAGAGLAIGSGASRFWEATRADLLGTNSAASVIAKVSCENSSSGELWG